jgi:hypothetical protein
MKWIVVMIVAVWATVALALFEQGRRGLSATWANALVSLGWPVVMPVIFALGALGVFSDKDLDEGE